MRLIRSARLFGIDYVTWVARAEKKVLVGVSAFIVKFSLDVIFD